MINPWIVEKWQKSGARASTHRGKITPNGLCNETVKGIE